MRTPSRLQPLVDDGLVDEVLYRLMSGKEADVFVVRCGEETRCAKVYKDALKRSFKKAVQYQEGRKVRNTRRARAMEKGSRFGKKELEEVWQSAEVDALRTLAAAGVRVPETYGVLDGVLLMELVCDEAGDVAPQLAEVVLSEEQALEDHAQMMQYIARMLCAGIIHGDLSEFNVLLDSYGPVIIDMPQAVNAAANNSARSMLLRDVRNITAYYSQFAPQLAGSRYGEEIWALYEDNRLHPDSPLSGQFADPEDPADVDGVIAEIQAVLREEAERRARLSDAESEAE
jgi:RIO kinase 1